ncbi:MAG: hypothetical protein ACR2IF_01015 [Terriglobales bacterium]
MSLRKVAISSALFLGLSVFGVAQTPVYQDQGIAAQAGVNSQGYQIGFQDGVSDGQFDHQANQSFRANDTAKFKHGDNGYTDVMGDKDQYKAAYRQGYLAGYQQGYNGTVAAAPQAPAVNTGAAYQNGFQDGINDGTRDLQSGHSFRATNTDRYEDADSGYNSSLGDKDQYKAMYRQGYAAGYQQAFSGGSAAAVPGYGQPATTAPVAAMAPPVNNVAFQNGYRDGVKDGMKDRDKHKDYHAMKNGSYNHGDDGYVASWGDKEQYKRIYRQGYMAGYERGYNGGGY